MIDVHNDKLVSLAGAAREPSVTARRNGKPMNHSTIFRWATVGVAGQVLETVCIGGARMTTREAMEEFFRAVTAAKTPNCQRRAPSPSRRQQIRAASRRVVAAGM
jgi:hypothetical protein